MNNITNLKYLFYLFLLVTSCGKGENYLYEFDPGNLLKNNITLKEIADDISYIPLNGSYKIDLIYEYYFINNSIYLSAKDIGVLIFNRDGKLITKIGALGRGPGEYYRHTKFTVDNNDNQGTIFIQDSENKIKVYSNNGDFLRSISFKEYIGNIDLVTFYNSRLFLFNFLQFGDAKYNWIIIDTLGQIIDTKERTMPIFWSNWSAGSGTYYFNNNLYYWNDYNDTVYKITPDLSEKASFLFSPGEHRLPLEQFNPQQKLPYYMLLRSVFETKKYFVLYYTFNKKGSLAFVDKNSYKSFLICWETNDQAGLLNNLDGGVRFLPSYYYSNNNNEYIVSLLEPFILKKHVASEEFKNSTPKYPEKKKELEKLAANLKETDNPVLVLVRLKE